MSRILSHPFRLLPAGTIATVEQDSPEGQAEQIAVLALTHLGERPLAPGFGITDPLFSNHGIEPTELIAGITEYGPPVNIIGVEATFVSDVAQDVKVTFE